MNDRELKPYLSPLSVWALSFGCAVGWGAFVMPGTTFLPRAGAAGTIAGILIGAVVMLVIGMNYNYLINKFPDAGGTLTYTLRTFGYDHGFLSSWFLALVYLAIIWANASALGLISKNLLGSTFQFGFHYRLLGYDVYMGEVLLSIAAILICGGLCIRGRRLAAGFQILFALLLIGGVAICSVVMLAKNPGSSVTVLDFSPNGKTPASQVFTIIALSPWAYVGFESVSNSARGFKFSTRWTIWILTAALFSGAMVYILLTQMAVAVQPDGYADWAGYIGDLGRQQGLAGLPVFYSAYTVMGRAGVVILCIAAFAGIVTGLIGNFIAGSRLMYSMAEDGILPQWFGKLNNDSTPENALIFLMPVSVLIPFLGRTAIGWIVDVNTVGATIAYAYTSAAAFAKAGEEKDRRIQVTGAVGTLISVVFFFYFMGFSVGTMSTESYLILASWSILGFVYFRYVFSKDKERRFGKSTVVWIGLLFLIFFTSLMWIRQATDDMTREVVSNISEYYEEKNAGQDGEEDIKEAEAFLARQMIRAEKTLNRNSFIQMTLIVASLAIMFSIYSTISKREKQMETEKILAEEGSRAKSVFLSNMSHDIRTPMNAILGYANLAEREDVTFDQLKDYLGKIKGSSSHLLALINDILEMSRIESGKMELELVPMDIRKTIEEAGDLFATQMDEKKIAFTVDVSGIKHACVYCDKILLNRVLLNLVSNAYKFTPTGGSVSITASEKESNEEKAGSYEIRVADSGIGMSEEFAAKVFEAFERERTSTVSGIQGTGLGMSITKSIIDLMGGTIDVATSPGKGTEFTIALRLSLQDEVCEEDEDSGKEQQEKSGIAPDFGNMRLLLTEDIPINREIATMQLEGFGFMVETAENGREALDKISASDPGYYNAVLMDIQMPVMDGYEAVRAIRAISDEQLSSIPVIAMTANAFSEDIKKARDAGMNGHIAKPIDVEKMLAVLSEVLGKTEC